MRMPRTSIAGLMGTVLVIAFSLAALRSGSEVWAGAAMLVARSMVLLAVVGAICRTGRERAWWLGFALFGASYLSLIFAWGLSLRHQNSPTNLLLNVVAPRLGPQRISAPSNWQSHFAYLQVGHCLFGLLAALLGGLTARWLFGQAEGRPREVVTESPPGPRPSRRWWRRPALVAPAGFVVASGIALVGMARAPGVTAAVMIFATWGLLGVAAVAVVFGPRERRAAWLGAAFFGIGFVRLIFGDTPQAAGPSGTWPRAGVDRLLYACRAYFPGIVREVPDTFNTAASNTRILEALARPIPIPSPAEITLEELIRTIREATRGPDGPGIPIYVDPIGLAEREQTMRSMVRMDFEGVPLRTSLRLALRPLELDYEVRDGLLTITGEYYDDGTGPPPVHTDPFLVVGHCLLALFAAGLGALLAPLVCGPRRRIEST